MGLFCFYYCLWYYLTMNKQDLEAKRLELETSFNNTKAQIDSLTTELYRLQGEFRAVNELITKLESEEPMEATPEVTVVDEGKKK